MVMFCDRVLIRGGATPDTYDGAGSLVLNQKAAKLEALIVSNSLSIYTVDESNGMAVQLGGTNFITDMRIPAGWISNAGTAANVSPVTLGPDIIPIDKVVSKNTTVEIDLTTILGATQTGTHDVTIGLLYSDGDVPSEIVSKIPNIVGMGGCNVTRDSAVTTTAETPAPTFTIPAWASEIIGGKFLMALDTAVTASQELTGYIRLELGVTEASSEQKYPLVGGYPNLGTDVDGAQAAIPNWTPMYIPLPDREITVRSFTNLASAMTGGVEIAISLAYR